MAVSDGEMVQGDRTLVQLRSPSLQATFVPRPAGFCSICGHGLPAGADTCTTCLTIYGLPMPGVA